MIVSSIITAIISRIRIIIIIMLITILFTKPIEPSMAVASLRRGQRSQTPTPGSHI